MIPTPGERRGPSHRDNDACSVHKGPAVDAAPMKWLSTPAVAIVPARANPTLSMPTASLGPARRSLVAPSGP